MRRDYSPHQKVTDVMILFNSPSQLLSSNPKCVVFIFILNERLKNTGLIYCIRDDVSAKNL